MLTRVAFSADCEAALAAFRKAGGVVEFFAYSWSEPVVERETVHHDATRLAHAALRGETVTGLPSIESWVSVDEFLLGKLDSLEGVFREPAAYLVDLAGAQAGYASHIGHGVLYAFTEPPYGLASASPADVGRWWAVIAAELFNAFGGDLQIARWSNDWSTFFESGREWWGTFWWTVLDPERCRILVVAASSTD